MSNNNNNNHTNDENTPPPVSSWSKRQLFGGAIHCDIPSDWRDVSDIRQVPDNQEVYQEANTNRVIVIELVEYQSQLSATNLKEVASFFFYNLAEDNGITTVSSDNVRLNNLLLVANDDQSSSSSSNCLTNLWSNNNNSNSIKSKTMNVAGAIGYQRVAQGREHDVGGNRREQTINWIHVELGVLRLPEQETELLLTFSTPCSGPPTSSSSSPSFSNDSQSMEVDGASVFSDTFSKIVSTLTIQDWSLFGG